MKEKKYSIYKITYIVDGRIYIGKTETDPQKRWNKHLYQLKDPKRCHYLHHAMIAHGVEKFIFEVIAECKNSEDLKQLEIDLIALYNTNNRSIGFNLTKGGDGSSGFKHSEETKMKLSIINKNKIWGENNPMFGKTHTIDAINKIKNKNAIYYASNKSPMFGKDHTDESKNKISKNRKGKGMIVSDLKIIKNIRKLYYKGYKQIDLAKKFQISKRTIYDIIHKEKAYKNT